MQGPDRNTPSDGMPVAPIEPAANTAPAPPGPVERQGHLSESPPPAETAAPGDFETPQAASISRSAPEPEKESSRSRWAFLLRARRAWSEAHPFRRAATLAGGLVLVLGAVLAPRFFADTESKPLQRVTAAPLGGAVSSLAATAGVQTQAPSEHPDASDQPPAPGPPRVWRVAQLAQDTSASLVEVPLGHRVLLAALGGAHVSPAESQRLVASLGDVHDTDHFGPRDTMTVALDRASGRVVAYELAESPADVWQGREEAADGGAPSLVSRKLKLDMESVRVRKAVLVGPDLHASFVDSGLAPIDELLTMLDDALDGHAELSDIRPGSRLRIVATQEQVDGAFVRWDSIEAVEYFPATSNAPPVRVYRFGDESDSEEHALGEKTGKRAGDIAGTSGTTGSSGRKRRGWYDAKGHQPSHGGWRSPVPLARITSRFNPHRMHPVLHIVMPHNGVDFAAPVGAPVYATAAGTVLSVGNGGPCGNMVQISHPGNITSIYCHLSRFAAGLRAGMRVEQRQLIAYVGQTGRVTGPHLHFGIRKAGVVIDPMTLRLDGMRVVPRALRDEFDRQRASLDAELDGILLPAPTGTAAEAPVDPSPDNFYEEP